MTHDLPDMEEHLDEWLSGYVDGELTQQQRQRVELYCEQREEARQTLNELKALRMRMRNSRLSVTGEDTWRETMNRSEVKNTRSIGWILLIVGALAIFGVGVYRFVTDPDVAVGIKLLITAIYGGVALLLYSVLRQRLIERKTDKYKDVEI